MSERILLQENEITRALTRMAHEIVETNREMRQLVLLGIQTRGVALAHRLAERINDIDPGTAVSGSIDVTMYRDDLAAQPIRPPKETQVPVPLEGSVVVLVDDVLASGRTVRAALDAITSIGRPLAVKLAVLIDRGHRELPIRADFVGKNLPTARQERVYVRLQEYDGSDEVSIGEGSV